MERLGKPGGDRWLQQCLHLSARASVTQPSLAARRHPTALPSRGTPGTPQPLPLPALTTRRRRAARRPAPPTPAATCRPPLAAGYDTPIPALLGSCNSARDGGRTATARARRQEGRERQRRLGAEAVGDDDDDGAVGGEEDSRSGCAFPPPPRPPGGRRRRTPPRRGQDTAPNIVQARKKKSTEATRRVGG